MGRWTQADRKKETNVVNIHGKKKTNGTRRLKFG